MRGRREEHADERQFSRISSVHVSQHRVGCGLWRLEERAGSGHSRDQSILVGGEAAAAAAAAAAASALAAAAAAVA